MTSPAPAADLGAFPPTRKAALARLAAVRPDDYARTRNHLDGAVTRLSPYFTHGLLTLPEALGRLRERHALPDTHRLVMEFGWRAYFHHVARHRGDAILDDLHPGPRPRAAYADVLPADALKVSIEAGVTHGWERYVGNDGLSFGIDSFGASAPADQLYKYFGLTAEAIVPQIKAKLGL